MGIIFVSVFILLIVKHAKPFYLAVAYPMLLAGGAVLIESFIERGKWRGRILKPVIVTVLVAIPVLVLPMLPVLPPRQFLAYKEILGLPPPRPRGSGIYGAFTETAEQKAGLGGVRS